MATVAASCKSQKGLIRISSRLSGVNMDSASIDYSPPERFFQGGTALNRVLEEAPYQARCSDHKSAERKFFRKTALRFPYMQINRAGRVSWLIFDLDHVNAMIWEDAGLPPPNLIVRNPRNGHSHLFYAISPVCTTEKARQHPIDYMRAVYETFAVLLKADLAYNGGPVAKTPGHPEWHTTEVHNRVFNLGDLAEYVQLLPKRWGTQPKLEDVDHSRNCTLFEALRYYAYGIVNRLRETSNYETFRGLLGVFASNFNSNFASRGFAGRLLLSELRALVKSVGKWTWNNYRGGGRYHRGVMELDASLPLPERQSLAAKRTNKVRSQATETKIRSACVQLVALGRKITQTAVAAIARLSRQTVATHKRLLQGAPVIPIHNVKHAAHQIPPEGSAFDSCAEGKNEPFDRACDGQPIQGKQPLKNVEVYALRSAVLGVEQTNRRCSGVWGDWEDAQHVADTYEVTLCDVGKLVIERAIATEGANLDEDLAAVEHAVWGDGFERRFWGRPPR